MDDQRFGHLDLGDRERSVGPHSFVGSRFGLRRDRLLSRPSENGSVIVGSVFGVALLLILILGVISLAFGLYQRNLIASATHEGARAAIGSRRGEAEAEAAAVARFRDAAGNIASNSRVAVEVRERGDGTVQAVMVVDARLHLFGPVPIEIPVRTVARVTGRGRVP